MGKVDTAEPKYGFRLHIRSALDERIAALNANLDIRQAIFSSPADRSGGPPPEKEREASFFGSGPLDRWKMDENSFQAKRAK
jgi:hypothetical protein